jgi:DnaJ domain
MTNHQILQVPHNASKEEIKKAYRRLARACHPDVNDNDPIKTLEFMSINTAYKNLMSGNDYSVITKPYIEVVNVKEDIVGGGCFIEIVCDHIVMMTIEELTILDYHWTLLGIKGGRVYISKKHLEQLNYSFVLRGITRENDVIRYNLTVKRPIIPLTRFQKFVKFIKSLLSWKKN